MSAKLLVVADDLTGANATAAALARDGLHVVTVMDACAYTLQKAGFPRRQFS